MRVLATQTACPKDAVEFVDALRKLGVRSEPTMVNFRGFHSPDLGAFFIFESASTEGSQPGGLSIGRGDLLFGHFTTATGDGRLVANKEDLVIELIVWDPDKQFFNFYEFSRRQMVLSRRLKRYSG